MAEEEEDDDHDEAETGLCIALLLEAEPGPVLPDVLESTPDQRVEDAQGHHGDEQADQKRPDQVVAKEIAYMRSRGRKMIMRSCGTKKPFLLFFHRLCRSF